MEPVQQGKQRPETGQKRKGTIQRQEAQEDSTLNKALNVYLEGEI